MFSQTGLPLVLAVGCCVGAVTFASRFPNLCITNLIRRFTGSPRKQETTDATVALEASLVDEVVAAPITGLSPSETAEAHTHPLTTEALHHTAASPSAFSSESAEVLVADDACMGTRSSVAAGAAVPLTCRKQLQHEAPGLSRLEEEDSQIFHDMDWEQQQVVAAPVTDLPPFETELPTAVATSPSSSKADGVIDAAASVEARPCIASCVADVEQGGNTHLEVAEGCGRQSAEDAPQNVQPRARRQQHKNKCRGSQRQRADHAPAELEAKEAKAAQAGAELLQQVEREKAAQEKAAEKRARKKKQGKNKPKQAPLPYLDAPEDLAVEPSATEDVGLCSSHCEPDGGAESNGVGAGPPGPVDVHDLRQNWEALLEQAAGCKDAGKQPIMLARLAEMMPCCSDAGISVKYSRKVLQRLQEVGPAREALKSALSAKCITQEELEAALMAAKGCRSLLEVDLVQVADDMMAHFVSEHNLLRQQQLAQQQAKLKQQQLDQQLKCSKQASLRQQQQPQQRRQAGQQVQMHGPAGQAVPMTQQAAHRAPSVKAPCSTAEPRAAGHKAQQPTAASTSSRVSAAAGATQRHTGRQVVIGSSLSAAPGSGGQGLACGGVGLYNQGNTCYQASALQCLICLPEVVQAFSSAAGSAHGVQWQPQASVGPAFGDLLAEMRMQQHSLNRPRAISPRQFVRAVAAADKRWGDGCQQDSQEFLHSLLEQWQSESNRIQGKPRYKELCGLGTEEQQAAEAAAYARSWHNSFVDDLFGGFLQSTVTCSKCHHQRHCFDPFLHLAVPIPNSKQVSVQDCLSAFAEAETLTGSEQVRCSACKETCDATKRLRVFAYPKLLVVSLKRFNSCNKGGDAEFGGSCSSTFSLGSKNETPVKICGQQPLDLAPYCSSSGLKAAAGKGCQKPAYELLAMSEHYGCLGGGHYTARGQSAADGLWYQFDDSCVTADSCPSGSTSSAYVLFYRLLDG